MPNEIRCYTGYLISAGTNMWLENGQALGTWRESYRWVHASHLFEPTASSGSDFRDMIELTRSQEAVTNITQLAVGGPADMTAPY